MERQEFVEQFAELVARVKRIERWQDQWASRDRRVQNLIANEVRLNDGGSDYLAGFKAGGLTATVIWTLPAADGEDGQFIRTNGVGILSFDRPINFQSQINDINNNVAGLQSQINDINNNVAGLQSQIDTINNTLANHSHSE